MSTNPTSKQVPDSIWIRPTGYGSIWSSNKLHDDDVEYARVTRKYFCSCGAACTAEEYIEHYFWKDHDSKLGIRK